MSPTRLCLSVFLFLFLQASGARAQAYERARPAGRDLCRSSRTFTYALVAAQGHPTTPERAAVEAAIDTWRQAASACSDLVFERAEDVSEGKLTPSGKTLLSFRTVHCSDAVPNSDACWADDSCSEKFSCWGHGPYDAASTTLLFKVDTAEILGGHIELDASAGMLTTVEGPPCTRGTPTTGSCVGHDVQSLVTRSIGESLGFAKVASMDSAMSSSPPWGTTQKRILDSGTLQGLCELYPRGKPMPGCDSPPPEETPETPAKGGCSASASGPLLGAAVLLLRTMRRPRRAREGAPRA